MQIELNSLLENELITQLPKAKVGIIVQGIVELTNADINQIASYMAQTFEDDLFVAAVGYSITDIPGVVTSAYIEDAVQWRNTPECAGRIVAFVRDDIAKMHSLADFDTVTTRDLVEQLLVYAQSDETLTKNEPQRKFWQALQRDTSMLQLGMLIDYVNAVAESNELDAISQNLWRLGLLPDAQVLRADIAPLERLSRNRSVLLEMEQLSDASKRRMKTVLTKAKGSQRENLRIAYRLLMSFYSRGERDILAGLQLDTVEQLLKASKPLPKTEDSEDSGSKEDPPSRPAQGKELERLISDHVVSAIQDDWMALHELGESIRQQREEPQESTETLSLGNRQVKLATIPDKLLELLQVACMNGHWGGVLRTGKTDLKTVIHTWEAKDLAAFNPGEENNPFNLLLRLENSYSFLSPGTFSGPLNQLIAARDIFVEHLELLANQPLVLFGGYPEIHETTDQYLAAYTELLRSFRQYEPQLHNADPIATRKVATGILKLDVIYIDTPIGWKAMLTPLHPLHLWRYREIIKALRDDGLNQEERQQLAKTLPEIPHLLHFIIVSPDIAGVNDIVLPQSGNLGLLPTYENKTNRYLGTDGIDFLTILLKQWLIYAPYSRNQVRIALIDAPDLAYTLQILTKYLSNNPDVHLVISVYSTSQRNYQPELARLDYDDRDYEMADQMRKGRLRTVVHNVSNIEEAISHLQDTPVHIAYVFDQAEPRMEKSPRSHQLVVSPLVISYDYEYSPIYRRGTITPSSSEEDGLFGDYYFVVERAGQLPPDMELRVKYGDDVDIAPFNDLLKSGGTRWLAIADRVLTAYYAPESGIPLGERRIGQREVAVWALETSRSVQRFIELLRHFNLKPYEEIVVEMIKQYGHISAEGILSLPSVIGNAVASQEKGLLGTLLAAKWYTIIYPDALVASLDTDLAKLLLQGRVTTGERADLIGVRYTEDKIIIEPIEVKTRQNLEAGEVKVDRDNGQKRLTGHAVEQLISIINTLRPVFGGADGQRLMTPARRETLKYQLYRECFREVHEDRWQKDWFDRLNFAFSEGRDRVEMQGLVLHIQLEQSGSREVSFDEVEPIAFVRITSDEIQKLIEPGGDQSIDGISRPVPPPPSAPPSDKKPSASTKQENIPSPKSAVRDSADETTPISESPEAQDNLSESDVKEIKQLARQFLRSCEAYRIQIDECDPDKAKLGPNVWRLYFTLASGQSMRPLQTHLEDIAREMGRSGLLLKRLDRRIALDIPRLKRETVYFEEALPLLPSLGSLDLHLPSIRTPEEMPLLIGVTPEGDHIVRYLNEMPHLLVGGTTGSGKTMFLYSVLASLLYTHPNPSDLRLFLAASGLDDFFYFEGLPHLENGHVIADAAEALEVLQTTVIQEFEARSDILTQNRCQNIAQYNERFDIPLPPLVVVIDEFADLSDQLAGDRAAKQQFHDNIRRIAQLGRKRGVYLVLCTQRPSADLVPTNIRSLLNARVALRVNDAIASRMILEETGAEQLQSAGDLLFKEQAVVTRAQSYFVKGETLEWIVGQLRGN